MAKTKLARNLKPGELTEQGEVVVASRISNNPFTDEKRYVVLVRPNEDSKRTVAVSAEHETKFELVNA